MKMLATLLAASLAATALARPAFALDKQAERDIFKLEQNAASATTLDQMMAADDPKITLFDLMPPTVKGYDAVKQHNASLIASLKNVTVTMVSGSVMADGELGFANSVQRVTMKDDKGNITMQALFRVTDCYHKVGDKWLMVWQHNSFPVDLATGKAVMAAK